VLERGEVRPSLAFSQRKAQEHLGRPAQGTLTAAKTRRVKVSFGSAAGELKGKLRRTQAPLPWGPLCRARTCGAGRADVSRAARLVQEVR